MNHKDMPIHAIQCTIWAIWPHGDLCDKILKHSETASYQCGIRFVIVNS